MYRSAAHCSGTNDDGTAAMIYGRRFSRADDSPSPMPFPGPLALRQTPSHFGRSVPQNPIDVIAFIGSTVLRGAADIFNMTANSGVLTTPARPTPSNLMVEDFLGPELYVRPIFRLPGTNSVEPSRLKRATQAREDLDRSLDKLMAELPAPMLMRPMDRQRYDRLPALPAKPTFM